MVRENGNWYRLDDILDMDLSFKTWMIQHFEKLNF